ncbi:DNA polymerase III subunit gamma/tau [Marinobacterium weihaiense]|uniref:DNA polymerase III subunit gamma/tau n=1 Tax=Marinobacterium weihaiense TaxID=2851016 RepID=A0ABS6M9F3_9GAMM|nr:DNA polymerase III subunit gamma/tau [Marinobacterium weihaiense]MBV0932926.1 DNA polymerase III subunit gamma/tau [Marinobacterium weihaiense]
MSYQVLARKWRPKRFVEMVGQEHVLKALVNALDDDRLHHAYLFTGTRGVGKTSIARLFAKSLNCEVGVSSEPCGQCSACVEIAEGRFVDLIEVDAASRTKVEDTRELLENVQYAPTHGRFKVYLIDEVHMLSNSSFNALLKTLEEPPPHVKFLLATTDPQKLPMTVLSRCLQFNLKNLTAERIQQHLEFVLGEESVSFEVPALWLLARAADGSMRDALSLTDQAIAFGAGAVREADVRAMLGTIDQHLVYRMLGHVAAHEPQALLESVQSLAEFSPDYQGVLGDIVSLLHRIALAQVVPAAVDNSLGDRDQVLALAQRMRAEEVQLYYQVALMGRKDLPLVPEPREGLEMTLLRMLAFRPAGHQPLDASGSATAADNAAAVSAPAPEAVAPAAAPAHRPKPVTSPPSAPPQAEPQPVAQALAAQTQVSPPPGMPEDVPPWEDLPPDMAAMDDSPPKKPRPADVTQAQPAPVAPSTAVAGAAQAPANHGAAAVPTPAPERYDGGWSELLASLGLSGMAESLARNLSLEVETDDRLCFHYMPEQEALLSGDRRERIIAALQQARGAHFSIEFVQAPQTRETPAQRAERKRAERLARAVADIEADGMVQTLINQFGARIDYESIRPID